MTLDVPWLCSKCLRPCKAFQVLRKPGKEAHSPTDGLFPAAWFATVSVFSCHVN